MNFNFGAKLNLIFDAILVPQGAEYQAVCRGLGKNFANRPSVVPIPVGPKALTAYLQQWLTTWDFPENRQPRILLMGLCGSLSPRYRLGDTVLYLDCTYTNDSERASQECDRKSTMSINYTLNSSYLVRGLTSDRIIWSALEKSYLGKIHQAEVVDMEGFAALKVLNKVGIAVTMIRVISDECHQDIPNFNIAFSADGSFDSFGLAFAMLQKPRAAAKLIGGASRGLKTLEGVTKKVFSNGKFTIENSDNKKINSF